VRANILTSLPVHFMSSEHSFIRGRAFSRDGEYAHAMTNTLDSARIKCKEHAYKLNDRFSGGNVKIDNFPSPRFPRLNSATLRNFEGDYKLEKIFLE